MECQIFCGKLSLRLYMAHILSCPSLFYIQSKDSMSKGGGGGGALSVHEVGSLSQHTFVLNRLLAIT